MPDDMSAVPVGKSPCPSCGRATSTTDSGACAECWEAKIPGGRDVIQRKPPRTQPLFGFSHDALDLIPAWAWWLAAGGVVSVIVVAVRTLI